MMMYLPTLASGSTGLIVATSNASNFGRGAAGSVAAADGGAADCANTPETGIARATTAIHRIIGLLTDRQYRKRIRHHLPSSRTPSRRRWWRRRKLSRNQ